METLEYLLSYGQLGDFGRFRAARPLTLHRGERAVVRSHRGVEMARVLRPATPGHAHFLPNTTVGQLLRPAGNEDEATETRMRERGRLLLDRAAALIAELALPLEAIDAEVLLDEQHAVLHHLRGAECDVRPLVSSLSREFAVHLLLQDLTRTDEVKAEEHEDHGCGEEGCGGGNCGSCGSGGGCGTCGTAKPEETKSYFSGLREQMERKRVPLN